MRPGTWGPGVGNPGAWCREPRGLVSGTPGPGVGKPPPPPRGEGDVKESQNVSSHKNM